MTMNTLPNYRARQRTITVHLHQPTPPVQRADLLRGAVPVVWFLLGYFVCLLTRF
jgi:hypothetical protein